MADDDKTEANNDGAIEPNSIPHEVPTENPDSGEAVEAEESTDKNENSSEIEGDPDGTNDVTEESSPPNTEENLPAKEKAEDGIGHTVEMETSDGSGNRQSADISNNEPTEQPADQSTDQHTDQSADHTADSPTEQPIEEHETTQANGVVDDNKYVQNETISPESDRPNEQDDKAVEEQPIGFEATPLKYDAIIEEEEESRPDIAIATMELPEEEQFIDDEDNFQTREFPDAYATPPPPEGLQDDDGFHEYIADQKEDSDRGSTPEYPIFDRAHLLDRYREVREERLLLQNLNNQLQHKLAEYFKKKKTDERAQEIEKSVTDQEQRYLKYISNLQELQQEERRQLEEIKAQKEDMKHRCLERQEKVTYASDEFVKFKHDVAKSAINSRSGKPIAPKDSETLQLLESKKEEEVRQVRLDNIKLKNKLRKKELLLKAKEELAEGLHLIDFEQLKIENQTYNEKIEERNEEILKLRKKITTTVQVLTHLKEKLQFVQGENGEQRIRLKSIDATVAQKRDVLTRTKQVRDALRIDNLKLRQKCGLLGNESLLRDFEVRKEEGDDLGKKLTELKTNHTGLSMNLNGVKKKITQARVNTA